MKTLPVALLAAMLLAACAGFDDERHLAPVFSELSIAGGDREVEAFGGAVIVRRDRDDGRVRYWAVRPLISRHVRSPQETFWWYLPPLGSYRAGPREKVHQLLPVMRFARKYPEGEPVTWSFLMFPGIYWAKTNDNRIVRAWFPFGGVVEHFLSMDRAWFVLWPLYTHIERHGRTTRHFLWPFFTWSTGAGGTGWRVWPLAGRNRWEGRYDRWFFLWPFFHWQTGDLLQREELHEHSWLVWPLVGYRRRGDSRTWTALWPFFGLTRNSAKGFWAWDGPWPLVRLQSPGDSGQATRWRFWPLYSYYKGDGLTSRWFLWPLFNRRRETAFEATKDTTYLFPVWHSWDRTVRGEGSSRWRKLFPLYRTYHADEARERFFAFPSLNPLWRLQFVDEHFAWMWELYARHHKAESVRERTWLGLYRRERDMDEDRRSIAGLWARRAYWKDGRQVEETSLLLGLLRWRTTDRGRSLLLPAFPGPGLALASRASHTPLRGTHAARAMIASAPEPPTALPAFVGQASAWLFAASLVYLAWHMRGFRAFLTEIGERLALFGSVLARMHHVPKRRRWILDRLYVSAIDSLHVVLLVAIFIGMIVALQTGIELARFGQQDQIGFLVAASMAREMGPFITAIVLAATVGSALAAELGTMNVSDELSALEVMSIDRNSLLVLPRVIALAISCPMLTILCDFTGVLGGGFVAVSQLNVGWALYSDSALEALQDTARLIPVPRDVYTGLLKSFCFGALVAIISCSCGMKAQGGALGVGQATSRAVRDSIIAVIVSNYFLSWLIYQA